MNSVQLTDCSFRPQVSLTFANVIAGVPLDFVATRDVSRALATLLEV